MGLEPAKLADYVVQASLGVGATARVYGAVHKQTGRAVAIKVLEMPHGGEGLEEIRERFAREAVLLAAVQSRHVAKLLGFGFDRGTPFLILERLHGETLDERLKRGGPAPFAEVKPWVEQLLVGVRDCHDAQVIHRDIKPSNIFLHAEGERATVKLIDFGVARLREIAGDSQGITAANHMLGSMGYMAPEQFMNAKAVGFCADLYAVGVVLFRALSGRLPFVSRSYEVLIRAKLEQTPPRLSTLPGMPEVPALDAFLAKALSGDPRGRFRSAREMLDAFGDIDLATSGEATSIDVGADAGFDVEAIRRAALAADLPDFSAAPSDDATQTDGRIARHLELELGHQAPQHGKGKTSE